jgi:hypothetical protein
MTDETKQDTEVQTPEPKPSIDPQEFELLRESVGKLEAKNRELLEEKAKAKQAAEQAALETAKKSGDLEALETSWRQKLESTQGDAQQRIRDLEQMITRITSGAEARKLAADLALPGHSDLLLPHIERRLSTEVRDGKPEIRVLDKDGKPTAMSLDDLRKEIETTPVFAPILSGSRANGAGVPGNGSGKATKKFAEYSSSELVALRRENPAEYDRIKSQHYAT